MQSNLKIVSSLSLILFLLLLSSLLMAQPQTLNSESGIAKSKPIKLVISIKGLSKEEKKNTLVYLDINSNKNNPKLNKQWLMQLHSEANKNIQQALEPFGYYHARISSSLEQDTKGVWQARYEVSTGERVKYSSVDVKINGSGRNDPDISRAQKNFPIKKGDYLDHEDYESAKNNLLKLIGKRGYADVKLEKKQLRLDLEKNSVELILAINSGEKYYLGHFHFQQNSLAPELLNRYTGDIQQGDVYSQQSLLSLQQSLISSGYFSMVDIKPDFPHSRRQHVPINVNLHPIKKHKLSFGFGYDTEIDLNASARWQNRLLNRSGHNTDVLLKVSNKVNSLRGSYWLPAPDFQWLPGTNPRTDKVGVTIQAESEDINSQFRQTLDLEASYNYLWHDWATKVFLEYKYEKYTIGDNDADESHLLSLVGQIDGIFLAPSAYPRSGWAASAQLRGTPGIGLSSTEYLRIHLKSRLILPVHEEGRLLLRAELGIAEVSNFDKYPSSLRFFAGGDQSVRGYTWKALGPNNSQGDVIGGKHIVSASVEYNHKISQQWLIATFIDTGNAFNNKLDKLYYGSGIGARWISPAGLIRFDLGWPVNADDAVENEQSPVFYFGFEVNL